MMNYPKKDVLVGVVIVLVLVAGFLLYKKLKTPKVLPSPTPVSIDFRDDLEKTFKFDIPEDIDAIELKDVSGGNGRGLATATEILADISDPEDGYFYQAWLQGSNDQERVSLGKMRMAKGGWLLEYDGSKYPQYRKVYVSLEKTFDNSLENKILEGSF